MKDDISEIQCGPMTSKKEKAGTEPPKGEERYSMKTKHTRILSSQMFPMKN